MPFGNDLWDKFPQTEQYVHEGIDFMGVFEEFVKRKSELEKDYAKALKKLVKPVKETLEKKTKGTQLSSIFSAWSAILNETETISNSHTTVSEKMLEEIGKSVHEQQKNYIKSSKQRFDEGRKLKVEMKKVVDHHDKIKAAYIKATKEAEAARLAFEKASVDDNATKGKVDHLRHDAEQKALVAKETLALYEKTIVETNVKKNQFYDDEWPSHLNIIQQEDETNRIAFVQTIFRDFVRIISDNQPRIESSLQKMTAAIDQISPAYDSNLFIGNNKSGEPLPSDFTFDNSLAPKRANSASTISRNSTLRLTPKALQAKPDEEDNIVALPENKGRKKAVARAKELEKVIADLHKKMQGVYTLISVYDAEGHPQDDEKIRAELQWQKKDLENNYDNARARKHKLDVYLALCDGVKAPPAPQPVSTSPNKSAFSNSFTTSAAELSANGSSTTSPFRASVLNSNVFGGISPEKTSPSNTSHPMVNDESDASRVMYTNSTDENSKSNQQPSNEIKSDVAVKVEIEISPSESIIAAELGDNNTSKVIDVEKKKSMDPLSIPPLDIPNGKLDLSFPSPTSAEHNQSNSTNIEEENKINHHSSSNTHDISGDYTHNRERSATKKSQVELDTSSAKPTNESEDAVVTKWTEPSTTVDSFTSPVSSTNNYDSLEPAIGRVRLTYDFEASSDETQELTAMAGEELDLLEKQDDGWWRCRQPNGGKEGYVPGNYCEEI